MTAKNNTIGIGPTPKESGVKLGKRIEAINAKGWVDCAIKALKQVNTSCCNVDEALTYLGFAWDEIITYLEWNTQTSKRLSETQTCERWEIDEEYSKNPDVPEADRLEYISKAKTKRCVFCLWHDGDNCVHPDKIESDALSKVEF